jgi:hypothetical protein
LIVHVEIVTNRASLTLTERPAPGPRVGAISRAATVTVSRLPFRVQVLPPREFGDLWTRISARSITWLERAS